MKKVLLSSILALGSLCTLNAQMTEGVQARIYAYGLQQTVGEAVVENGTITSYTLTFKTNTAATSAKVNLMNGKTVVASFEAEATDATKKSWKAVVNASKVANAGTYTWAAEVSAPAVENWATISDHTNYKDNFVLYRSYGLAIDNNPENDAFGTIYAVNQATATSYTKGIGMWTYNPELTLLNSSPYAVEGVIGDVSSADSPSDMAIDSKGLLYLSNSSTNGSGVYVVDPTKNYSAKQIFEGTRENGVIKDADGKEISSMVAAVGVYGKDSDREIFTIDNATSVSTNFYIKRYEIGTQETWNTEASFKQNKFAISKTENMSVVNKNCAIEPIAEGYWITQYRGTTSKYEPILAFINNNNEVKYNYNLANESFAGSSQNGAIAVDEKTKTVAVASANNVIIMNYDIATDGTVTTSNEKTYSITTNHRRPNDMAFDYAGNLYSVTSNKETLSVWSVPTANNTCITPAKSTMTIEITANDIQTGVEEVGVDANAPVEYYNLQGVKVENPSNGIFIKKQGSRTSKVVL